MAMDQQVDSHRKNKILMMLATLMASATYGVGFNPPGGVWQDGAGAGHLPGDPIMRSTHYRRYLVFFYFNAAAFVLSLMVVVITLVLKKGGSSLKWPLHLLMGAAMTAYMGAFGTGACRDKFSVVLYSLGVAGFVFNGTMIWLLRCGWAHIGNALSQSDTDKEEVLSALSFIIVVDADRKDREKYGRKLVVPLSMFALTLSYVGGLSTPGGFWDNAEGGHRPGDSILHGKVLHWFFYLNIGQFFGSLYAVGLVRLTGLRVWLCASSMMSSLFGLIAAYTLGSSRGRHNTVTLIFSLYAAVVGYIILHVALRGTTNDGRPEPRELEEEEVMAERERGRASALVQLLAGLAVAITYQAGMYPPGGVWQDGHNAGDPILHTTNPGRYKAFFYCNSVAFVASLLAIFLGQKSYLIEHHALQAAMILDLLSLVVAYAIGSCRDQISTMYALGIAGAAVVYVVVHVQYFTLGSNRQVDDASDNAVVDKRGGRFLVFAILVASVTYQAGLTPPGGFLLQDDIHSVHRAGNPVLQYNHPGRYKVFFYCNSVSFMLSTVLILLLVNPSLYRPAIKSHAMLLCSAVSFTSLIGAFAAGSTQNLKTSISIVVLVLVAAFLCLALCLPVLIKTYNSKPAGDLPTAGARATKPLGDKRSIYLMTLAILVGSATYQAGLDPPGGSWQSSSEAGNPVMHDNRKSRYLVFLCGNTVSFVAAIYLIELLLFRMIFRRCMWFKRAIRPAVVAQYLGFLVAYAAGSSRQWKMSAHVGTLVIAVLAYVTTHIMLSRCRKRARRNRNSLHHRADQEASVQERVKREKDLADYLLQLRWILVIFVVLPFSSLISLNTYLGDMWSASKSDEKRRKEHEDKVQKVVERLKRRNPNNDGLVSTAKKPWMSMRTGARNFEVDLSSFRNILQIDTERMVAKVEPLVSMGQISRATCPMNLSLAVVPELDDLTVGGLINSYGIQGSSHMYGQFSDTVIALEMVLADGKIVRATKDNEYSDLFHGVPWSQGTLGLLVSAEIMLIPVKDYVKVTYIPVKGSLKQVAEGYADSFALSEVPDLIEGIVYSEKEGVVMTGVYASKEEANKEGNTINNIGWWFKPWFYQHARTALDDAWLAKILEQDDADGGFIEYIPTRQYYHRHARSLYWEGKLILPFGDQPWFRYLLGWLMPPNASVLQATQGEAIRKYYRDNHVNQDMLVPLHKLGEAIEFVHREMEVYPLWLCPHRVSKLPMKTMVHPEPECELREGDAQMFTDVGVHYFPASIFRGEEFKGVETARKMERWLIDNNSFQPPQAVTELSDNDLWPMFDASHYEHCRQKYGAVGTLISLHYKSMQGNKTDMEVREAEPAYAQHA